MTVDPATTKRAKWKRRWVALAIACVGSVALAEAFVRVALFSDVEWGWRLRVPWKFADRWNEPLYFQLMQRWENQPGELPAEFRHPELGWVNSGLNPTTLVLDGEANADFRRPVLLFGDSYARCMTDAANCFEGWLERSEAGASFQLFNYGVRGFGLDQAASMALRVAPRWKDRKPIVVVGIYLDDDLDRAVLDYRGWPKPRLRLSASGDVLASEELPTPQQYEARHPLWKRFYTYRWLVHGSGLLPTSLVRWLTDAAEFDAEKQRLADWILTDVHSRLSSEGIEHFFLLFPSRERLKTVEPDDWRERFVLQWLETRGVPYVNVRRDLLRDAFETGRHPSSYFGLRGLLAEHLTPDGNEVASRGLIRGLQGHFDDAPWSEPVHSSSLRELGKHPDLPRLVREQFGWSESFPDAIERERALMYPAEGRAARYGGMLSRPTQRFTARARWAEAPGFAGAGAVELTVIAGNDPVQKLRLDSENPIASISVDLTGKNRVELRAELAAGSTPGCCVVIGSPRFR